MSGERPEAGSEPGRSGGPSSGRRDTHWILWAPRTVAAEATVEADPARKEAMLFQGFPLAGAGDRGIPLPLEPHIWWVIPFMQDASGSGCWRKCLVSPLRAGGQTPVFFSLNCRFCCNRGLNIILSLCLHSLLTTPTCPAKKLRLIQEALHCNAGYWAGKE